MGIMAEMGWAMQQLAGPALMALGSTAIGKVLDKKSERTDDNDEADRYEIWSLIFRFVPTVLMLLIWIIPKVDDMSNALGSAVGGWDMTVKVPSVSSIQHGSGPSWQSSWDAGTYLQAEWQSLQINAAAIAGATYRAASPVLTVWNNIWEVIGK